MVTALVLMYCNEGETVFVGFCQPVTETEDVVISSAVTVMHATGLFIALLTTEYGRSLIHSGP